MHEHHCPYCGHCVNLDGADCYPTTPNASIPCPGCPRVYYLDCMPARG